MERKPASRIVPIRAVPHGSNLTDPQPPARGAALQPVHRTDVYRQRERGPRYSALLPVTQERFNWGVKCFLDNQARRFDLDACSCDDLVRMELDRRRMVRVTRAAA